MQYNGLGSGRPGDARYENLPIKTGNAHSHLQAMLLSSSEIIPVVEGELQLGIWQSVILVELDGPRQRQVTVQVMGE